MTLPCNVLYIVSCTCIPSSTSASSEKRLPPPCFLFFSFSPIDCHIVRMHRHHHHHRHRCIAQPGNFPRCRARPYPAAFSPTLSQHVREDLPEADSNTVHCSLFAVSPSAIPIHNPHPQPKKKTNPDPHIAVAFGPFAHSHPSCLEMRIGNSEMPPTSRRHGANCAVLRTYVHSTYHYCADCSVR